MLSSFHKIIKQICEELEIEYNLLSKDWIIMLKKYGITKFISGYKFDLNGHGLGIVLDDKYAMYEVLINQKIPVIEHNIVYNPNNKAEYATDCNTIFYLKKLFEKYHHDVVLKINGGTCGIGVEHITDLEKLEESFSRLIDKNFSLSLCPYYEIKDEFRVIVLNGKIKLIYRKERPIVVGNGKLTVKDLLLEFNPSYFSNKCDNLEDKVLKEGEQYIYDWRYNLSKGARIREDLTEEEEKIVSSLALAVSTNLDLSFCSVDIIKTDEQYYILEINSGVMMENYIMQQETGYTKAYEIYKEAVIQMFHEDRS